MTKEEARIPIHRPGINELMFFLLCGAILSVPLTLFIEQYFANPLLVGLSPFTASLISVAVFAPFIEEFSKVFPLFYRHGETQRSIFNLALFVGLGFGIFEFATYVFALGVDPIARLPGLIATKNTLPFYLLAVGLHFSNNIFVTLSPWFPTSVLVVAATVFISWRLHDKTKEKFI